MLVKGIMDENQFPMRVFKWTIDFRVDVESNGGSVWISLEFLLIHFFWRNPHSS